MGAVSAAGFALLGGTATPVGLSLAGALLGFLIWNRPPARIYLGDAGAYMVGTTIALLPALTCHADKRWSVWWAVPLLVGVPISDTAIAMIRRRRAGRSILTGDRGHIYDQLVDRGLSVGCSTLLGIGAQLVFTSAGLTATLLLSPAGALTATLLTAALTVGAAQSLGFLTADAP